LTWRTSERERERERDRERERNRRGAERSVVDEVERGEERDGEVRGAGVIA